MNKVERCEIIKWVNSLSDEELENEYYKVFFSSLGSQTEYMYELGYDIRDIKERERYEKFLCEKSTLLGELCVKRGIKLWEETKIGDFPDLDKVLYSDRCPYIEEEIAIQTEH